MATPRSATIRPMNLNGPWRKSSHSNSFSNCTEVRRDGDAILMRDSKQHGAGPVLSFTPREWLAFTDGIKDGQIAVA